MEWLFILGVAYMVARGWENGRSSRAQRRIAAAARPGVNHATHQARARRQATAGWWVTEITHLFPVTREGFRDGWADHQQHLAARQHAARQRDHAHNAQRAVWWEEAREYWRELTDHREQQQGPASPLLPDGRTPGRTPDNNREAPMPAPAPGCTNPSCACHAEGSTPALNGSGNGTQPGGTSVTTPSGGDATFHSVNEICDRAVQEAEQAGGTSVAACTQVADALGSVIRDDAETMGLAHDLATAARKFEAARAEMIDAAQALKARNQQAYAAHQEARDSTGVAPEAAYTAG